MNFLEPAALWGILAGLLVILAYLLRMPRRRRIFSSSILIKAMELIARRERRKLRTILSFAVIFLAFLATALNSARPFYSSEEQKLRDHILLLDVSASMKARTELQPAVQTRVPAETRFDRARQQATQIVHHLPVGHRMMIVAVGNTARIVRNFETDAKLLEQSLESIRPEDTSTSWGEAARLLQEILPAAQAPLCHLLSDGSGWQPELWTSLPGATEWRYYPAGKPVPNVGLTNFRGRTTFHSDRDYQIITEVRNFSTETQTVELDLYLDDLLMDTHQLKLEPAEKKTEVFQQTLRVGGILSGRLRRGEEEFQDGLEADNVAYDVVPSPVRPKVLIYSSEKTGFLEAALSANANALAYKQSPENYSPAYAADIYVFYNLAEIPEQLPNRDLIFIHTRGKKMPVEIQKEFENPVMRTWNQHHPLMNYLSLSNLLLSRAQGLLTPGWAETLAETASGPLIVAGETPERQIVFIGLDPRESDLPFRAAMPLLVANAILWMKEPGADPEPLRPGETCQIQVEEAGIKLLELTAPSGQKIAHDVLPGGHVAVLSTREVGVYRYQAGEQTGAFTVNLSDAVESDLTPQEQVQIGEKKIEAVQENKVAQAWRFWPALAFLALGLLVVENSLYHRRVLF